jgi:hypothetical protein
VARKLRLAGNEGFRGLSPERVADLTLEEIAEGAAKELLGGRKVGKNYIREGGDDRKEAPKTNEGRTGWLL